MAEQMSIGMVTCDFMSRDEFLSLCQSWLKSSSWHHVVTLNAEMVVLAQKDSDFRTAVMRATVCVSEGGPLWARLYLTAKDLSLGKSLWMFTHHPEERITGVDMIWDLAKLAAASGQAMYLLGGTDEQSSMTAEVLKRSYPTLFIATSADHDFTINGPAEIVRDIQNKKPAILCVAYGAPKQTLWLEQHKDELPSVKIAIGVGGAFAMLSGQLPRAPYWLRQRNVEWVWRLFLQPWRIGRIWRAVIVFPLIIRRQKVAHRLS